MPSRTCSWVSPGGNATPRRSISRRPGAEPVVVAHFAQGVRAIGAFAHAAVQVDVGGGDHRHRHRKRDGRHAPASEPGRVNALSTKRRADRDHHPGGEASVDARKPRARHREQDRPDDDGRHERETAEQPAIGARGRPAPADGPAQPQPDQRGDAPHQRERSDATHRASTRRDVRRGRPRGALIAAAATTATTPSTLSQDERLSQIGARLDPSSGTSSRIARYSAIPTPEKIASPTNAIRNRIGSTSKCAPSPLHTPPIRRPRRVRTSRGRRGRCSRSPSAPDIDCAAGDCAEIGGRLEHGRQSRLAAVPAQLGMSLPVPGGWRRLPSLLLARDSLSTWLSIRLERGICHVVSVAFRAWIVRNALCCVTI